MHQIQPPCTHSHIWNLHRYRVLEVMVTVECKALNTHRVNIGLALVWLASPSTHRMVEGLARQTSLP